MEHKPRFANGAVGYCVGTDEVDGTFATADDAVADMLMCADCDLLARRCCRTQSDRIDEFIEKTVRVYEMARYASVGVPDWLRWHVDGMVLRVAEEVRAGRLQLPSDVDVDDVTDALVEPVWRTVLGSWPSPDWSPSGYQRTGNHQDVVLRDWVAAHAPGLLDD